MRAPFGDDEFPAAPYPGARPDVSFAHLDGVGRPLRPDRHALAGWRVDQTGEDLDDWLAECGGPPMARRVPVLAYGSNACPSKITWLRESLGLNGPVVVLRARCEGLSAVWAAGLRAVDDQRPATLMATNNVVEQHAVWMADQEQVRVLDACEGRGRRYRLARVRSGRVVLDDGSVVDRVLAYTAADWVRQPLLVRGRPVRCADLDQAGAQGLVGKRASSDGIKASTVDSDPSPDSWPRRVFVYGTLQPGDQAWRLIEPMVTGRPRRTTARGTLYDTGMGYPALTLDGDDRIPGWVLPVRSPRSTMSTLDKYEGPDYRRTRIVLSGGQVCWTYVWTEPVKGMPPLPKGWTGSQAT